MSWQKAERAPLEEYQVAMVAEPLQQIAPPEDNTKYERMPTPMVETMAESKPLEIPKIDVGKLLLCKAHQYTHTPFL